MYNNTMAAQTKNVKKLKYLFIFAFIFAPTLVSFSFSFAGSLGGLRGQEELISGRQEYDWKLKKANKYFDSGFNRKASDILWEIIHKYPEKPDAYINLSFISIAEKRFETAIRLLERAEELSGPDYFQREILFYNLGLSYYNIQDYQKAHHYLARAVGIYPDFAEAFFCLAKANQALGNIQNAYLDYFRANYLFSQEENKSRYRQVTFNALVALEENPSLDRYAIAQTLSAFAQRAVEEGRLNRAAHFFDKSIDFNPQKAETYRKVADLYVSQNAFHNARIYLDRLGKLDLNREVCLEMGRIYRALHNYDLALESFQKSLDFRPNDPLVLYEIALTYFEIEEYSNAEKFIVKAEEAAQNSELLKEIKKARIRIENREVPKERVRLRPEPQITHSYYLRERVPYGNLGKLDGGYFHPPSQKRSR